ncbi:MAG: hypothetical protein ABL951_02615 [Alphaproteobacteria bacterium]
MTMKIKIEQYDKTSITPKPRKGLSVSIKIDDLFTLTAGVPSDGVATDDVSRLTRLILERSLKRVEHSLRLQIVDQLTRIAVIK